MKGVRLSDHFTYKKLFKAVLSPILMMVFTSIYGIVDGLFISNVEGDTAFSAVNLIIPVTMAIGAIGFMFGAGGSALVSKTLGEGDKDKAQSIFTAIVIINAAVGLAISVLTFIFVEQIVTLLGATPEMKDYAVKYGRIILIGEIAFMTQNLFQNFFIVAERPHLGFIVTVGAGVTNMILDAVMVAVLRLGVEGAAIATVISQVVGSVIPIIYFAKKNTSLLRFRKPAFRTDYIFKTVTNGFSEFLSNVSASFVSMVYNKQLMSYRGQDGVTAYGIIMYASFIFAAVFIGYAIGTAPIIGYNYGAQNHDELKKRFQKEYDFKLCNGYRYDNAVGCVRKVALLDFRRLQSRPARFQRAGNAYILNRVHLYGFEHLYVVLLYRAQQRIDFGNSFGIQNTCVSVSYGIHPADYLGRRRNLDFYSSGGSSRTVP